MEESTKIREFYADNPQDKKPKDELAPLTRGTQEKIKLAMRYVDIGLQEQINALKQRALSGLNYKARIDLKSFYELLETQGIVDSLARSLVKIKNFREIKAKSFKDLLKKILLAAIPKGFILNNIENIKEQKRKSRNLNPEDLNIEPQRKLYHVLPDKSLLKILSSGKFKSSTETNSRALGTGDFEKHVGINGMFACFEDTCEMAIGENILIYPGNLIKKPKTICIQNECSMGFLLERQNDFWDELKEFGFDMSELDDSLNSDSRKILLQITVGLLLKILCDIIILPEDVVENPRDKEIVIVPQDLPEPEIIFVDDDPGYFAEEIPPNSPFSNVPIVDFASVRLAVIESRNKMPTDSADKRMFIQDVGEGLIDLKKWKYKKDSP